jgi:hypothetical protein
MKGARGTGILFEVPRFSTLRSRARGNVAMTNDEPLNEVASKSFVNSDWQKRELIERDQATFAKPAPPLQPPTLLRSEKALESVLEVE